MLKMHMFPFYTYAQLAKHMIPRHTNVAKHRTTHSKFIFYQLLRHTKIQLVKHMTYSIRIFSTDL